MIGNNTAADSLERHDWQHPARMPSRFGVGLMLLFLTLFSVGFWILNACGVPPAVILFLTLLFTLVALAQILWPSQPRVASTLAGGMFLPLWTLAFLAFEVAEDGRWIAVAQAAPMAFCMAPLGAICGYLAGALLAGIFLWTGWGVRLPGTGNGESAGTLLPIGPSDLPPDAGDKH